METLCIISVGVLFITAIIVNYSHIYGLINRLSSSVEESDSIHDHRSCYLVLSKLLNIYTREDKELAVWYSNKLCCDNNIHKVLKRSRSTKDFKLYVSGTTEEITTIEEAEQFYHDYLQGECSKHYSKDEIL